ncbi:hypothetical protein GCM10009535_12240 [Streptomyces thermocarboxydovorans]|uniref:Uncharacterized protein n=1 Tax=Streptomyces thermocarboxydovorans TaxID=59298 RepID=A0ABP3SLH8_9ACTN
MPSSGREPSRADLDRAYTNVAERLLDVSAQADAEGKPAVAEAALAAAERALVKRSKLRRR